MELMTLTKDKITYWQCQIITIYNMRDSNHYKNKFVAYRKVYKQLGIKVGESEYGGANMLRRLKIDNPTQQEKDDMAKKAVEEHHAILFVLQ